MIHTSIIFQIVESYTAVRGPGTAFPKRSYLYKEVEWRNISGLWRLVRDILSGEFVTAAPEQAGSLTAKSALK